MRRGARLAKSLAGLTTLAAMFTDTVATATPKSATTATMARVVPDSIRPVSALVSWLRMKTGSQSLAVSTPGRIAAEALVTITPIAEKAIMVVGRPRIWPTICSFWPRP